MTKTQFIIDDHGKKTAVILPIKTYDKLMEELDDIEDVRLFDEARKRKLEFVDANEAFKLVEKKRKKK